MSSPWAPLSPGSPEWEGEPIEVSGLLDLREEGYGFLRVKGFDGVAPATLAPHVETRIPERGRCASGLRVVPDLEGLTG